MPGKWKSKNTYIYWTQTIYKNKQRFLNPIKQNRSHIQALKAYLDLYDDTLYIPIIVFTGDAKFKNVHTETTVIHRHELFWTILNYDNEQKLSREAVQSIYNTLSRKTNVDASLVNKHTHAVKYKSNERLNKERANICPRCNNSLVIRRGPYGKFYGCTGYPNCRYSKPL